MKGFLAAVGVVAALVDATALFTGAFGAVLGISPYVLQVICLAGINVIRREPEPDQRFTGQFSISATPGSWRSRRTPRRS